MKKRIVCISIIILSLCIPSCFHFSSPRCNEDSCYSKIGSISTSIVGYDDAVTVVHLVKEFKSNSYYLQLETIYCDKLFYAYLSPAVFKIADGKENDGNEDSGNSLTIKDGDSVKMVLKEVRSWFEDNTYCNVYYQIYSISKEQVLLLKNFKNLNIGPFFVNLISSFTGNRILCCQESGKFELNPEDLQIFIKYVLENP